MAVMEPPLVGATMLGHIPTAGQAPPFAAGPQYPGIESHMRQGPSMAPRQALQELWLEPLQRQLVACPVAVMQSAWAPDSENLLTNTQTTSQAVGQQQ